MKQKIVLQGSFNDAKSRTKGMKIAVGVPGVTSVGFQGEEKNKLVVMGEGIDSVLLTNLIRKGVGFTELVSVRKVDQDDLSDSDSDNKSRIVAYRFGVPAPYGVPAPFYAYDVGRDNSSCFIM